MKKLVISLLCLTSIIIGQKQTILPFPQEGLMEDRQTDTPEVVGQEEKTKSVLNQGAAGYIKLKNQVMTLESAVKKAKGSEKKSMQAMLNKKKKELEAFEAQKKKK